MLLMHLFGLNCLVESELRFAARFAAKFEARLEAMCSELTILFDLVDLVDRRRCLWLVVSPACLAVI